MSRSIRTLALGLVALALVGFSVACNTMEGMGKDTEKAGEAVQDAAK